MSAIRFEEDLKLLTKEQLTDKYGPWDWDCFIWNLQNGTALPPLTPIASISATENISPFPVDEEADPLAVPPYKGRAFGKFVMIRRLDAEHSGNLVMPERIAGTSDLGWVASVGEKTEYIEIGMIVAFDQYASVGRQLRLSGVLQSPQFDGMIGEYLMIEEPDILAVLEKV